MKDPLTNSTREPLSLPERIDNHMWSEHHSLNYNLLDPAPWVPKGVLPVYRTVCFLFFTGLSLFHLITNAHPTLLFFTNWGIFFTAITFIILFVFTIRGASSRTTESSPYSPWKTWKWGVFCFETSLTFELIITVFFWAVLFPLMKGRDPLMFIDHITPVVCLLIEYSMNRMPFTMKHAKVSVGILLIYGVVNIAKTVATGEPVYPPLNFKDVMSYVYSVLLIGFEVLNYFALTHLTQWKLKKMGLVGAPVEIKGLKEVEEEDPEDIQS